MSQMIREGLRRLRQQSLMSRRGRVNLWWCTRRASQWRMLIQATRRSWVSWWSRTGQARLAEWVGEAGSAALLPKDGCVGEAGWVEHAGDAECTLLHEWWQDEWEEETAGLEQSDCEHERRSLAACKLKHEDQNCWTANISSLETPDDKSECSHFLFLLTSPETNIVEGTNDLAEMIGKDVVYVTALGWYDATAVMTASSNEVQFK